ncbi:hypothetical protein OKW46_000352 [Paraburkholderia sp. WSM4179]|nr:hypothetical protein [Paraburkholderia sp. WSM4179]
MRFDPAAAAAHLEWSWQTGLRLGDLPPGSRPSSLNSGYAAQALFVERIGEPVIGWKIAGASPRGLRGELIKRSCHRVPGPIASPTFGQHPQFSRR